jgi:GntR family transcriptional repressor for pyruvate dehydrogenase complex
MLEPARRSRLSQDIIAQICQMIRHGRLQAGDRLPSERELAEQIGVSRPSLREALRALEIAGLVESRHGGGTYVRDLFSGPLSSLALVLDASGDMVGDLWEVRTIFEPPIAARAALRAAPEDIDLLGQIVNRMGEIGHDPAAIDQAIALDRSFHAGVVRASGNAAAMHVLQVIHQQLQEGRRHFINSPARWGQAQAAHCAILTAIRRRQPQAAHDAMLQHLQDVEAFILGSLIEPREPAAAPAIATDGVSGVTTGDEAGHHRAEAVSPSGRRDHEPRATTTPSDPQPPA